MNLSLLSYKTQTEENASQIKETPLLNIYKFSIHKQ